MLSLREALSPSLTVAAPFVSREFRVEASQALVGFHGVHEVSFPGVVCTILGTSPPQVLLLSFGNAGQASRQQV